MKNKKQLPGPVSERQSMYMFSEADVTLFGGENCASIKLS
jgi:hypothetical protein